MYPSASWLAHALLLHVAGLHPTNTSETETLAQNNFLYFAYGSNLLARRIHINNPTAQRVDSGRLKGYRLDFNFWSTRWGGYAATVVPHEGREVWGAVWSIDESNLDDLDRQEGVNNGVYIPIQVTIETKTGKLLKCRSYQLTELPPTPAEGELWSPQRPPSQIYWEVILKGAAETGLPVSYIDHLRKIPHNGYTGDIKVTNLTLEDIPNEKD